jgi:hypothetical protein
MVCCYDVCCSQCKDVDAKYIIVHTLSNYYISSQLAYEMRA